MFAGALNLKIAKRVIPAIVVNMVDNFAALHATTQMQFHDANML